MDSDKHKQPFVVLAQTRTGSSFVVNELARHPGIQCYGAFLSAGTKLWDAPAGSKFGRLRASVGDEWATHEHRVAHWRRLVDLMLEANPDTRCVGFKYMLTARDPLLERLVNDPSLKVILLHRDNALASYSSGLIARSTGQQHARTGDALKIGKAPFDEVAFERFAKRRARLNRQWIKRYRRRPERSLIVEYNEVRAEDGIDRLVRFLGEEPGPRDSTRLVKRNSDDIVSRFEQPDVVAAYLARSGRESWATEQIAAA